jgi:hypothetical protein
MAARASSVPTIEEWMTPEISQESPPSQTINPQVLSPQELPPADTTQGEQPQMYEYTIPEIEGDSLDMPDASAWLDDLAEEIDPQWLHLIEQDQPASSPPTSLATDPRTANGTIYRACNCPEHQEIYEDWPIRNAELVIARCMKTCMYCGMDFTLAAHLRKHLNRLKYTQRRNLTIVQETRGKWGATTPAWTPKPGYRMIRVPDHETPTASASTSASLRVTRSQSATNSDNGIQQQ